MIKKVSAASSSWMKPLHVGHVTVFTKEQDYQGITENRMHQYFSFSNLQGCTCGVANVPNRVNRIVGGSESAENKYPWMISVMTRGAMHRCGGSLISRQHVITAAHCVVSGGKISPPSTFTVSLGEHDFSITNATRVSISEIIPHPKYMIDDDGNSHKDGLSHYDIAVLKLSSPILFTQNIGPVCLPAHTMGNHAGKDGVITGWGKTESGQGSPFLKEANVTILTNKDCNKAFGATDRFIR